MFMAIKISFVLDHNQLRFLLIYKTLKSHACQKNVSTVSALRWLRDLIREKKDVLMWFWQGGGEVFIVYWKRVNLCKTKSHNHNISCSSAFPGFYDVRNGSVSSFLSSRKLHSVYRFMLFHLFNRTAHSLSGIYGSVTAERKNWQKACLFSGFGEVKK